MNDISAISHMEITTPIGPMWLSASDDALLEISWNEPGQIRAAKENKVLATCAKELREYFAGQRRQFSVPLALATLSPFRRRFTEHLSQVPFGARVTYGDLAKNLGGPTYARAVGTACGANPWPIIVPCHRVLGASGKLTGFAGGIWRKEALLAHEISQALAGQPNLSMVKTTRKMCPAE